MGNYTVEKVIEGKKYVAQFSGLGTFLKALDNSYLDGSSNTSVMKMAEYLFEHAIVEPKGLTVDDFKDMAEFNKVVEFARETMQGNNRPTVNEKTSKKNAD